VRQAGIQPNPNGDTVKFGWLLILNLSGHLIESNARSKFLLSRVLATTTGSNFLASRFKA
jgi:hypothetical protein